MKRFTTGASHLAILVNLSSSSTIGRVPVRVAKPRLPEKEDLFDRAAEIRLFKKFIADIKNKL